MSTEERAAILIQGLYRTRAARRAIKELLQSLFEKCHDPDSGYSYYFNKRTGESQWEKPRGLGNDDLEDAVEAPLEGEGENEHTSYAAEDEKDNYAQEEHQVALPRTARTSAEPSPAPPPTTNDAMCHAWRTMWTRECNMHDAKLVRIDVYSASSPQRYAVVEAFVGVDIEARPSSERWQLYTSFFAFDRPVPGATEYTVYDRERPYRCKVTFEPPGRERASRRSANEPVAPASQRRAGVRAPLAAADVRKLKRTAKGWSRRVVFYAFYNPRAGTTRYNVQEVINPLRHRISTQPAMRGGWGQSFCFFAYPTTRYAVLDCPEPCLRCCVVPFLADEHPLPHPPLEVRPAASTAEASGEVELGHWGWARKFEFFAFGESFPGTITYSVLASTNAPLRYKVAMDGPHATTRDGPLESRKSNGGWTTTSRGSDGCGTARDGWIMRHRFHAFPMAVPGTTRYYVHVARKPTRYVVTMEDALKPWSTLFSFYAYPSRRCDTYDWRRREGGVEEKEEKGDGGDMDWVAVQRVQEV